MCLVGPVKGHPRCHASVERGQRERCGGAAGSRVRGGVCAHRSGCAGSRRQRAWSCLDAPDIKHVSFGAVYEAIVGGMSVADPMEGSAASPRGRSCANVAVCCAEVGEEGAWCRRERSSFGGARYPSPPPARGLLLSAAAGSFPVVGTEAHAAPWASPKMLDASRAGRDPGGWMRSSNRWEAGLQARLCSVTGPSQSPSVAPTGMAFSPQATDRNDAAPS